MTAVAPTNATTLALNANWLEVTTNNIPWNWSSDNWIYPYWTYTCFPDQRPIKLGLSEVEKLRAAAKKDKALKAILTKFTDLIAVIVDFE